VYLPLDVTFRSFFCVYPKKTAFLCFIGFSECIAAISINNNKIDIGLLIVYCAVGNNLLLLLLSSSSSS